MAKSLAASKAKRTRGSKGLMGLMIALLVVGAAVGAGSALGKKDTGNAAVVGPNATQHVKVLNRIDITPGSGSPTGWIDVMGFSWGMTQTGGVSGGGGGGSGKTVFSDLHFTKMLDSNSPKLAKDCATGAHEKKAVFEVYATAPDHNETVYLKVTLTDVLVSSYFISGNSGGSDLPMESLSLNFAKIEFKYVGPDDSLSSSFTFDVAENKAV